MIFFFKKIHFLFPITLKWIFWLLVTEIKPFKDIKKKKKKTKGIMMPPPSYY